MDDRQEHDVSMYIIRCWQLIKRRAIFIGGVVSICTVVAVVYSLVATELYVAETRISPLGASDGAMMAGIASRLGGLAGLMPASGQNSVQKLRAILESRTVAERIVQRFDLLTILLPESNATQEEKMERAVRKLNGAIVKISENMKYGTVDVKVELADPQLAMEVANGYVDELGVSLQSKAFTNAKRNRIFLEERLAENKKRLMIAGKQLHSFYQDRSAEALTADGVESFMSDFILEFEGAHQTEALQQAMQELEAHPARVDYADALKDIPEQIFLDYLSLQRKILEQVNRLLSQEYVMAQIKESQEKLAFEVVDYARKPTRHVKPRRRVIVMVTFTVALFFAIALVFIREAVRELAAMQRSLNAS